MSNHFYWIKEKAGGEEGGGLPPSGGFAADVTN